MSFQVMFFSVNPFQFRVVTSCGTILHVDEHTTYIVIYTDQEKSRQDEHFHQPQICPHVSGILSGKICHPSICLWKKNAGSLQGKVTRLIPGWLLVFHNHSDFLLKEWTKINNLLVKVIDADDPLSQHISM